MKKVLLLLAAVLLFASCGDDYKVTKADKAVTKAVKAVEKAKEDLEKAKTDKAVEKAKEDLEKAEKELENALEIRVGIALEDDLKSSW